MTPLETRLTAALAEDVARFERLAERGPAQPDRALPERGVDLVSLRLAVRAPSRRRRSALAGVAAVALIALAIAAIAARRNDDQPGSDVTPVASSTSSSTSTSSTSSPTSIVISSVGAQTGVEQPLVETAPSAVREVAKPGSAHGFSVTGHPDLVIWTSLEPSFITGEVEELQCVDEAGGGACGSTSIPAQFSQTSSIDNRVATDDLYLWSNLPPEVAAVGYDDGVVQQWQRPVAGLAVFRVDPNHPHPDIRAFDAGGTVLPYSFWGSNPPTTTGATAVQAEPMASEVWSELSTLTQSTLRDCLTTNGATWTIPNVPTFSADVDSIAAWDSCVVEVKSAVAARAAELNKGG